MKLEWCTAECDGFHRITAGAGLVTSAVTESPAAIFRSMSISAWMPSGVGFASIAKLRRWLKTIPGLTVGSAVGLDPNHAWRHRLKTLARDAEIDSTVIDAICGHRPATVGAGYGEVSVRAKAAALAKLPTVNLARPVT